MHAIGQRNGRHTLWTGEAGLALFLLASVIEISRYPRSAREKYSAEIGTLWCAVKALD
jgi:hypothetical protein